MLTVIFCLKFTTRNAQQGEAMSVSKICLVNPQTELKSYAQTLTWYHTGTDRLLVIRTGLFQS